MQGKHSGAFDIEIDGSVNEGKSAFKMLELSSVKLLFPVVVLYLDKFAIKWRK